MDGLILIDKPMGMTSHDVVARVRRILNQQQIGHFGTLDPLATGLLLVAAGKITRLFPYYSKHDKTYSGEIQLGFSTETYDALGKPSSAKSHLFPERGALVAAMEKLVGPLNQAPPPYSAKKVDGQPLYKWARANKPVQPRTSLINVYAFRLTAYNPPRMTFEVRCSSGTYVRSLAHDLGQILGCGAHLSALRRLSTGQYGIHQAHSLEDLEKLSGSNPSENIVLPPESLLPEFTKVVISEAAGRKLQKGRPVPPAEVLTTVPASPSSALPPSSGSVCRIFSPEDRFLALARPLEGRGGLLPFLLL